jgi:hypothetical protein
MSHGIKTMKRITVFAGAILLCATAVSFAQEKRDVLVRKYFRNNNTYVIECKGYPREGLTGKPAVETAKEAALTNAQVLAGELFAPPVDAVKNGTAEKYTIHRDYVVVRYVVRRQGLRGKLIKR